MQLTQKALMLAGSQYMPGDPELVSERTRARLLTEQFNSISIADKPKRAELLVSLLGHVGDGAWINPTFKCDYGYNIRLGARSFLNYDCVLLDCNTIAIGEDVQIAPGVHIYTASHPFDPVERRSGAECAFPVRIEDGVWLGGGTIVCPGVTIGANTIVGAGTVVVKDLPANVLAVGNPARIVRSI